MLAQEGELYGVSLAKLTLLSTISPGGVEQESASMECVDAVYVSAMDDLHIRGVVDYAP